MFVQVVTYCDCSLKKNNSPFKQLELRKVLDYLD